MRIFESSFDLTMLNFRFSDKSLSCLNPGCYLGQFAVFVILMKFVRPVAPSVRRWYLTIAGARPKKLTICEKSSFVKS